MEVAWYVTISVSYKVASDSLQLTGDAEYKQWHQEHLSGIISQGLVVIWPQYRLMPESSGKEIEEDIPNLGYFLSNGSIDSHLLQKLPDMKAHFSLQDIVCSGVSAGGHMAWTCWVKWDGLDDVKVRINLMPSYYPMWSQYMRDADNDYCNVKPTKEELKEIALDQLDEAVVKRKSGEKVRGRIPPDHMGSLPLTACVTYAVTTDEGGKKFVVSFWQLLWNRPSPVDHVRAWSKPEPEPDKAALLVEENGCIYVPPIEIVKRIGKGGLADLNLEMDPGRECFVLGYALHELGSPPSYCPQIDFVHGTEDRNCELQDTREVKSFIEAEYGKEYIRGEEVLGKSHGFDITGTHHQLRLHRNRVCALVQNRRDSPHLQC